MKQWLPKIALLLLLAASSQPAWSWKFSDTEQALPAANAYAAGDYAKAATLYTLLAGKGNAVAQFNLGMMYAKGQHVPKNGKESIQWYLLAAEQGYAAAQFELGMLHLQGSALPQDYTKAQQWIRMAAEQKYARAQLQIGDMYLQGQGVLRDNVQAAHWYRMAAEQGNATAQRNLAVAYGMGQGVVENPVLAYMWLNLAAAHADNTDTQKEYADLIAAAAQKMSAAQIAEAQTLAKKCADHQLTGC